MLEFLYTANFLLMLLLPLGLALFLTRRFRLGWGLVGAGALTFLASQVVHLPLNAGLTALFRAGWLPAPPPAWTWFNPVVLGLTSGGCEELARYAAYQWALRRTRTWRQALAFGAHQRSATQPSTPPQMT